MEKILSKVQEEKDVVEIQKIVVDPRMSLKQFSAYIVATDRGRDRILRKSKYPGDYIPRYYEKARKLICETFSANFDNHELYFEEFNRQGAILREEAKEHAENRDGFKNRMYSANGLDEIVAMEELISPILNDYILDSNLSKRRDAVVINDVKIGSVADMLLNENWGATQVGFLKFNFTGKALTKKEAGTMLYVLKEFFERKGVEVNPKSCLLIDAFARRIFKLSDMSGMTEDIENATIEIRKNWNSI